MLRNYDFDAATSLGASVDGTSICIDKNVYGFSMQAVVTSASSLSGTLKLQASIDVGSTPTNWADVSGTSAAVTANGVTTWSVRDRHNFKFIRIVWTRVGGSGSMVSTFNENQ